MSDIITPSDITFNGEEIRGISEAVFESTFSKPALSEFHEVVNGVIVKKQIVILGRINELIGAGTGACSPTDGAATITMSEKFWDTVTVSDRLGLCWTQLKETFFAWGLKQGISKPDLTATDFADFVVERLEDAMYEMIYRLVWFNDTDAATTADSPAGVITAGTNTVFFNKLNGLWKQIFAIAVADTDRLTTGLASRNGQATFASQKFTSTDTTNLVVTSTLENMVTESDYRLRSLDGLQFVVTQSVFDQYKKELKRANIAFTTERTEKGIQMLEADGIQVFAFQFWDRIIRSYYSDGTKYYLPHRAILCEKTNLQVGTGEESAFSDVDIFYDKTLKKTFFDFQLDIDAKVIQDELIQVAY